MKIAARGFYFYIEVFIAILMLIVLLVVVKENPVSREEEFIYYDMTPVLANLFMQKDINSGRMKVAEPTEFKLKPVEFELINEETGEIEEYIFEEEKIVSLTTYAIFNPDTGNLEQTAYVAQSEEDLLRLVLQEKRMSVSISMGKEDGQFSYKYFLQGYETDRLVNLLYIVNNEKSIVLQSQIDNQVVRELNPEKTLNNRQNILPLYIAFAGSLMGFFIVMSYIFLDKSEGVIKAFAVTPSSVGTYLLSKTGVILTTVLLTSSVVTIPVMGLAPNYLLFYVFLIVTTFAFAELGLLISSFYESIEKAFGALYLVMVVLMLPAFSYLIPSFDPVFLRFFPTYPILEGFKDIFLNIGDQAYVLIYSLVFLVAGCILFLLANMRFRKSLTV